MTALVSAPVTALVSALVSAPVTELVTALVSAPGQGGSQGSAPVPSRPCAGSLSPRSGTC